MHHILQNKCVIVLVALVSRLEIALVRRWALLHRKRSRWECSQGTSGAKDSALGGCMCLCVCYILGFRGLGLYREGLYIGLMGLKGL